MGEGVTTPNKVLRSLYILRLQIFWLFLRLTSQERNKGGRSTFTWLDLLFASVDLSVSIITSHYVNPSYQLDLRVCLVHFI
jgi:hypothetical protein